MTYKYEWMGTIIEFTNQPTRCELKIDNKTQDFYDGLFLKKETCLKGKNDKGDIIEVKPKMGLLSGKATIYFNNKKIYTFNYM